MARISRDSLQWQSAINTFTSIFLTGIIAIAVAGYFTYDRADNLNISELDIFIFSGIAVTTLILLGLAFSIRIYIELDQPLDHLEQITHALPLLSSKKYDEAKEAFHVVEQSSKHREIDQLHYATLQLTSGADLNRALNDIKGKVDAITTFPAETEKPIVRAFSSMGNVMTLALAANSVKMSTG